MNFNEYMKGIDLNREGSSKNAKSVNRHLKKEHQEFKSKHKALKKAKSDDVFERNKRKATSTPMHKWMSQFD